MSNLEEVGNVLENLLTCLDGGITYIVHKDDFVTVEDSKGKSWYVFKKALHYDKGVDFDPVGSFIRTTKNPELYDPGIRVSRSTELPYDMRVLVKSGNGVAFKKLKYDETLVKNAEENGVKVTR